MGSKGLSIYYDENDLAELKEFIIWKTKKAGATKSAALNFSTDAFDVDNSLKETSELIAQARQEMEQERKRVFEIQQRDQIARDQRDSISRLDDRNAAAQEKIWQEEAKAQGIEYAKERNAGRQGGAYVTEESRSIRDGVVSWIERQRRRGNLGGQKALRK